MKKKKLTAESASGKEEAHGPRLSAPRITSNGATFNRIAPISLTERVIDALKDSFLDGQFSPGDPIVEREVARQMNVGTPVVREALINLQGQGFVRRVTNTGTFVTQFSADEVSQLYALRVELEALALQWARARVTAAEIEELTEMVHRIVKAGEAGDKRDFLQRDYEFHRRCWVLSGNQFLAETLDRLMAPLFAFVVVASGAPLTGSMGREHYDLVSALKSLSEPEFSATVRKTLTTFAFRWMTAMAKIKEPSTDGRVSRPA